MVWTFKGQGKGWQSRAIPNPGDETRPALSMHGELCVTCLSSLSVHSHNEFLLAILTRCQILVSTPGKGAAGRPPSPEAGLRPPWQTLCLQAKRPLKGSRNCPCVGADSLAGLTWVSAPHPVDFRHKS